jgi:protein-tyrosine phosphatase
VIDTHCHLLPGLDDGPSELADAVALAHRLAEDGVSFVLCTPHYSRLFPTDHAEAGARLAELRSALGAASVGLKLDLAAEIGPGHAVSAPLEELRRRSIRGRYLLIELLPDSPAGLFDAAGDRLQEADLIPIFAHPERSRAVQRHPTLIEDARRRGSLIQIVAPSLIGRWGRGVASAAWGLLGAGWVDLIGSDAHGSHRRGVHLAEAFELVADRLGTDVARDVIHRNPARILRRTSPGHTRAEP